MFVGTLAQLKIPLGRGERRIKVSETRPTGEPLHKKTGTRLGRIGSGRPPRKGGGGTGIRGHNKKKGTSESVDLLER